jgi:hypothetical protein
MMGQRNERPYPENQVFKTRAKDIDPDVVTRRSKRIAQQIPENRGMFPDMKRVNERLQNKDDGKEEEEDKLPEEDKDLLRELLRYRNAQSQSEVQKTKEVEERDLPYMEVEPLQYVPKQNLPPLNVKREVNVDKPAYKRQAPIQNEVTAPQVWEKIKDENISIPFRDLLAISPQLRELTKRAVTAQRQSIAEDEAIKKAVDKMKSIIENSEKSPLKSVKWNEPVVTNETQTKEIVLTEDSIPPAKMYVVTENANNLIQGSLLISDPIMQYLIANPTEEFVTIQVAKPTAALKSVLPYVNETEQIECILDGGSQICSMSAETARRVGIAWNPGIKIRMQSANGSIDETLGMAKNVPFRFEDVTIYLQCHILEHAAYQILLGRPFECVTRSTTHNFADGEQRILLTCPNTGNMVEISTHDRGKLPSKAKPNIPLPETALDPNTLEVQSGNFH